MREHLRKRDEIRSITRAVLDTYGTLTPKLDEDLIANGHKPGPTFFMIKEGDWSGGIWTWFRKPGFAVGASRCTRAVRALGCGPRFYIWEPGCVFRTERAAAART